MQKDNNKPLRAEKHLIAGAIAGTVEKIGKFDVCNLFIFVKVSYCFPCSLSSTQFCIIQHAVNYDHINVMELSTFFLN